MPLSSCLSVYSSKALENFTVYCALLTTIYEGEGSCDKESVIAPGHPAPACEEISLASADEENESEIWSEILSGRSLCREKSRAWSAAPLQHGMSDGAYLL